MRVILLESRKRVTRPVWQGALSVAGHLLLIGALRQAAAGAVPGRPPVRPDTTLVFMVPPPPTTVAGPAPERSSTGIAIPEAPVVPPIDVLPGPLVVPGPGTDPSPSPLSQGMRPDPRPGCCQRSDGGATGLSSYTPEEVDHPVVPVHQPTPRYPAQLHRLRIAGRVVAEFVVDTLGRVEPGSWRVIESTHNQFERAAHQALMEARFIPARVRDRAVRQLVRQSVQFSMR